ncbi:MAG: S1 RNA-binding domain-containing protein [Limnochordia bacterium]|jgi:S1 RNA binding domain protein|nr:S1 RNA-binding domain-containing protein [Limnochordia bacterium]MDD2629129.1 S1 RNA-binding domain-containing protein [Limnochordia bacterium]
MAIEVGSVVEGKVTGITNFGAFVELGNGKTGLIHISEVADAYVKDIKDFLQEEQVVKVKVINVENGKIGLSLRRVEETPRRHSRQDQKVFEDRLSKFLKDSDKRQSDLKRATDSKRGGRGGGRNF